MIERLQGKLLEKQPPSLVIDVNGIAYEVLASMNTFYHLPDTHTLVTLYTHLNVREDAHVLYGFHNKQERSLFRALIKVNGVGPKLALGILSGIDPTTFVHYVRNNDTSNLVRIPGIGPKTAERLIIETRDHLKTWETTKEPAFDNRQTADDAISALLALGYKQKEAEKAIEHAFESTLSSEMLIKKALKNMVGL